MSNTAAELGKKAHTKILNGNYREAIVLLNKAILLNGEDERLYSNRCYCFLEEGEIEKARLDALKLKEAFPGEKSGHFLMGEVYLVEGKNKDAEEEFHRAYALHPSEDFSDRLFEAQMCQILARGHDSIEARRALLQTRSVQGALSGLAQNEIQRTASYVQGPPMSFSAEEEKHLMNELMKVGFGAQVVAPKLVTKLIKAPGVIEKKAPIIDPANPLKSSTLWVGNLTPSAKESDIKKLFSKHGKMASVVIRPNTQNDACYAFVNYSDYQAAGKAMEMLQGVSYQNKKLIVRYHDKK